MIVIQNFPSVAALRGWLHNARCRCKDQYSFTQWLFKYLSMGRELTACGQVYDYRACMELLRHTEEQQIEIIAFPCYNQKKGGSHHEEGFSFDPVRNPAV